MGKNDDKSPNANSQWVRDKIAQRGLTEQIEAEAKEVAQAREELKRL